MNQHSSDIILVIPASILIPGSITALPSGFRNGVLPAIPT